MGSKKIRILIADTYALVRAGLRIVLEREPAMVVVGEAENENETVAQAQSLTPDVALIDVASKAFDGFATARRIGHSCPSTKVIILSGRHNRAHVRQTFAAGAHGYVPKTETSEYLVTAIKKVAGGNVHVDPRMSDWLIEAAVGSDGDLSGEDSLLSEREKSTLRSLAWGYSNKETAIKLGVSVKTVETYKARAMGKLEIRSRNELMVHAVRNGWLALPPGG